MVQLSQSIVAKSIPPATTVTSGEKVINQLQKQRKSKVRTGCITCKKRHVKCDEAKPTCMRCLKGGWTCDGYESTLRMVTLTIDILGNHQERRGYHFFRLKSVGEILGNQDAPFWNRLFLQYGHTEPAVKHILIAIASLHESLELSNFEHPTHKDELALKMQTFSLSHYNRAIQILRTDKTANHNLHQLGKILVLCLLFLVFEEFQSSYIACFLHLQNGVKLLQQWRLSAANYVELKRIPATTVDLVSNHLRPALNRLVAQALSFMDCRRLIQTGQTQPLIPEQFTSLAEARENLDQFILWMFDSLESQVPAEEIPNHQVKLHEVLGDWSNALDSLIQTKFGETLDPLTQRAVRFLRVYYHSCRIQINTIPSNRECIFDEYTEQFRRIVDLARHILHVTGQSSSNDPKLDFSFDLGLVPPLYFATTHCRDPALRRAALAQIRFAHRKQGLWHFENSAKVAELLIQLEEGGLGNVRSCADVPEHSRLVKSFIDNRPDQGHIKVQFVRFPYDLSASPITLYVPLRSPSTAGAGGMGGAAYLANANPTGMGKGTGVVLDEEEGAGEGEDRNAKTSRPPNSDLMASFVAKTYFPQDTI